MGPEKSEKPHGENSTQKRENPSFKIYACYKIRIKMKELLMSCVN